eukprot:1082941-Pleurochrysis_carterae.AAC.1
MSIGRVQFCSEKQGPSINDGGQSSTIPYTQQVLKSRHEQKYADSSYHIEVSNPPAAYNQPDPSSLLQLPLNRFT